MHRILIFHHCASYGGAGKSLVDIIESIDKSTNEIVVYCRSEKDEVINILRQLSVKVIAGGENPAIFDFYSGSENLLLDPRNFRMLLRLNRSAKAILRVIDEVKPNSIIVNSFTLCWIGDLLKKRKDIKKICFHRETYGKERINIRNHYIKYCLRNHFDKVAYISQYDFRDTGGNNGTVITDKVEIKNSEFSLVEAKKELKLKRSHKHILFLGGISELKGTHVALQMLAKLPEEFHLIIMQADDFYVSNNWKTKIRRLFGKDYNYKWKQYAKDNNLLERIHFYPTVFDIRTYYAASDYVLFSSTRPHQSRPLYEAGLYNRVCLISDFECTQEFAINNYNCITFKPGDAGDLAKKILFLEKDEVLKAHILKNNLKMTLDYHNIKDLNGELRQFLKDV